MLFSETKDKSDIVLVMTGYPLTTGQTSEVINLSDEDVQCEDFPKLHSSGHLGTGGYLQGNPSGPIVCGGFNSWLFTNKCYSFNSTIPVANMLLNRVRASSVVMDNGTTLWVTGGHDHFYHRVRSTEFVTFGSSHAGPDLPIALYGHCAVRMNSSAAMIIGGYNGHGYHSKTWIANFKTQTWTKGPDLNIQRYYHSCGQIFDSQDDQKMIVVVGGYTAERDKSTEIFHVDSTTWIHGPDLPIAVSYAQSVTSSDGKKFYIIGGENFGTYSSIYSFQCFAQTCQWKLMKQKLRRGRSSGLAMLIPTSMANCTKFNTV